MQTAPQFNMETKLKNKVWEIVDQLEAMYRIDIKSKLTIAIDIRGAGRLAGQAVYQHNSYKVRFHPGLLQVHGDEFINQVVPHEVCHIACRVLYQRKIGHGIEWKNMMRRLGLSPDRCHTYETLSGPTTKAQPNCKCSICGGETTVGPKVFNKIKAGAHYFNKCCGRRSRLIPIDQPTAPAPIKQPAVQPTYTIPPTNGPGTSKMDKCKALYAKHKQFGYSRQKWISLFVNMAGCTPAGASTYLSSIQKIM
jgi:SprT protein